MKELDYPFDSEMILKKRKRIKKDLVEEGKAVLEKKIAILGGSTTSDVKAMLELFLLNYGINPCFYESDYNQYYQQIMFTNPELEGFSPDIIYIHTTNRNISRYPELQDSQEVINKMLSDEINRYTAMWEKITSVYNCVIIQNNIEYPFYRLMGNKDASDIHGKINYINRLNLHFYEYAQEHENFFINDINYLSSYYGLEKWSDPFYWHMYKYACNMLAIPDLAFNIANIIKSIYGKNKKGFVLDLDNTLWGGTVGDDGVDHIRIGQDSSEGQVYSEFQLYLKEHKQLGVLLNVVSKNDFENALSGIQHPDSILKADDFMIIKANWDTKDKNISEIARELNILPESLVFVDDNPAERTIVKEQIKEIAVPEINRVENYIKVLDKSGFFEVTYLSQDDMMRNEMYKENQKRAELQTTYKTYEEYLISLEMSAIIKSFDPIYIARITQLINKTNQFNVTTKRYTQVEIENIASDPEYITLFGKLTDKFGDNGVVSIIIGKIEGYELIIELWIMSCRVLKRDMEFAMMDAVIQKCMSHNIRRIKGLYYPSAKNSMVKEMYGDMGFTKSYEDNIGNSEWTLNIADGYENKNSTIKVEE